MLIGVTGDGKSSTGNTLCASRPFAVSDSFKSETQECAHFDYVDAKGTAYRIIDTIGLHDTDLSQREVMDRFTLFADRTSDGIDAFLFVVRWGRFKPEHDAALSSFVANCGEVALRHTILVFTHCRDPEEKVQQALSHDAPATLRAWLPQLQGVVGIENELMQERAREVLHLALDRLCAANAGVRYSNEALAEARSRAAEVEEADRAAFQAAVADWRRCTGPVVIEREQGIMQRTAAGDSGAASSTDRHFAKVADEDVS